MSTNTTPINLKDISYEAFDEIVNHDVRGTLDAETSKALREPENVERWYAMLLTTKRRVEVQLTANKADQADKQAEYLGMGESGKILWLRHKAQNERWRKQAIWFKNGVEDKITEVKMMRADVRNTKYTSYLAIERDDAVEQAIRLRSAIRQHHLATVQEVGEQDDIDNDLWHLVG